MAARPRTARERLEAAEARRARRTAITDPDLVMAAAADFLAVRARSTDEARRRLKHLGYPAALVDEVIGRLVQLGYLDDAAFARAWVESRDRARPRGTVALRRELQAKGVPDTVIAEVLGERSTLTPHPAVSPESTPSADLGAARRLLAKRSPSLAREPDPRRRRQKAYALLARNGFGPDICHEVASEVASDPDE